MINDNQKEVLKKFLESKWLILLLGFLTAFSWVLKFNYFPYIILIIVVILILISNASFISAASLFFLYIGGDRNESFRIKSPGFIIIVILLIPMVFLLIKNIIKNARKYYLSIKNDWHIYSLLGLFAVMLVSIAVSPIKGVSAAYSLYFSINILVALMVVCTVDLTNENKDKLIFSILVILWTIAVEVLFKYISISDHKLTDIINEKELHLEWALSNHYMVLINIGMIMGVYSYIKAEKVDNKIFALLSIVIAAILNVLTVCRGGYLGLIPSSLLMFIAYIIFTKNWKREIPYVTSIILVFAICSIICIKTHILDDSFNQLVAEGTNSAGRDEIYRYAIDRFKENYLLGTGAGSSRYFLQNELGLTVYNYHNSFYQIASTCGIIGLIIFLIYLGVVAFRLSRRGAFNFFIIIVFVYFFTHGLVDTLFFNRKLMPMLTILICMIPKKEIKLFSLEENV